MTKGRVEKSYEPAMVSHKQATNFVNEQGFEEIGGVHNG